MGGTTTMHIINSTNSLAFLLQIIFWWTVVAFVFAIIDRLQELSKGNCFLETKLEGRSVIESFVSLFSSLLLIVLVIILTLLLFLLLPALLVVCILWMLFSCFISTIAFSFRVMFLPQVLFILLGLIVNGIIVYTAIHDTKAFGMQNIFIVFLLAFSISLVECLLTYYCAEQVNEYRKEKCKLNRKFSIREIIKYANNNILYKNALIILTVVFGIDMAINLYRFVLYQSLFNAAFESSFQEASFFTLFRYCIAFVMPLATVALPMGCSLLAEFSKKPFPAWRHHLKPNPCVVKNFVIALWLCSRWRVKKFFAELKLSFIAVLFWPYFLVLSLSKFLTRGGKK